MFTFKSIGHFFATVAHDLKVGATFIEQHQAQINSAVAAGAAVVSLADPALAPIASSIGRAEEFLLGDVLALVDKVDGAASQNGVSLTLDAAAIAEFKQLLADIRKVKPSAAVVPAGLPTI